MDCCAEISVLMGLALQFLPLALLVQTAQSTTTVGCYTSYQNLLLQLFFTLQFSHFESASHLHQ